MATTLADIEDKIRTLDAHDKAALIRILICELEGPPDPAVEKAWIAEAKRRHQALLDGRVKGVAGERVFSNIRALLAR